MTTSKPLTLAGVLRSFTDLIKSEPSLFTGFCASLLNTAIGFGLGWSPEQVGLVTLLIGATVLLIRGRVSPVHRSKERRKRAN